MKIKTKGSVVLGLAGMLCVGGLILNVTDGAEKVLQMDLQNAIQHINAVKLIANGSTKTATIGTIGNNLVGIQTDNFIISKIGDDINEIKGGSSNSNILGGIQNKLQGSHSSILGGEANSNSGDYSTILGGMSNKILEDSDSSTILGGFTNSVKGEGSVVAGGQHNNIEGNYSVTVGNSNTVIGNDSVALGTNSTIKANNSFLWTDSDHNEGELTKSNVFAVVSNNGMVVNAPQAHTFAQLTIGGPLIIDEGKSPQCSSSNSGVMKVVDRGEEGLKCLCGCDGHEWHSLYGQGLCEAKCNNSGRPDQLEPKCAQGSPANGHLVYRCTNGSKNYFNGKCVSGKVVQGTGAYFVTKDNMVHWACQTDDGVVTMCAGKTEEGNSSNCKI